MLYTYLTALALTTIALVASGCGGSSKKTTSQTEASNQAASSTQTTTSASTPTSTSTTSAPATPPLTQAQLIAMADPICKRANAKRSAVTLTTVSSYSRLLPLAAYERTELAELRRLTPPNSIAHDWSLILGDTKTITEATAKLGASPTSGRVVGIHELFLEAANAERQMLVITKRDGFKDCAKFS